MNDVMVKRDATMALMSWCPSVRLHVQPTSLLVLMDQIVFQNHIYVMTMMIVMMALMNMGPSVRHHVQLTSLPVLMGTNASIFF